ncbi:MAG: HNH endonuclease [Verrucomicrobiota bacterium]
MTFRLTSPRDWEERKRCVHERDRNHCQITGCLHTTGLGVHHIIPIHIRPDHRLENLVLLCRFHHALLPTHERLPNEGQPALPAGALLLALERRQDQAHRSEASVQRKAKARVTEAAMAQLFLDLDARYAIECRHCRARDWKIRVESALGRLAVTCMKCWRAWLFDRGLPEEIGVQLSHRADRDAERGGFELATRPALRAPADRGLRLRVLPRLRPLLHPREARHRPHRRRVPGLREVAPARRVQETRTWRAGDEKHVWA